MTYFLILLGIGFLFYFSHFYKKILFPWVEQKTAAYPVVLDFILNNEDIGKYVGEIYYVKPVFHRLDPGYSKNRKIDGQSYIGQVCDYLIEVKGDKAETFIRMEAKERGLGSRDFAVIEAVIREGAHSKWIKRV